MGSQTCHPASNRNTSSIHLLSVWKISLGEMSQIWKQYESYSLRQSPNLSHKSWIFLLPLILFSHASFLSLITLIAVLILKKTMNISILKFPLCSLLKRALPHYNSFYKTALRLISKFYCSCNNTSLHLLISSIISPPLFISLSLLEWEPIKESALFYVFKTNT